MTESFNYVKSERSMLWQKERPPFEYSKEEPFIPVVSVLPLGFGENTYWRDFDWNNPMGIMDEVRIPMVKRVKAGGANLAGKWQPIGGKMDLPKLEDTFITAVREFGEETNIPIVPLFQLGNHLTDHVSNGNKFNIFDVLAITVKNLLIDPEPEQISYKYTSNNLQSKYPETQLARLEVSKRVWSPISVWMERVINEPRIDSYDVPISEYRFLPSVKTTLKNLQAFLENPYNVEMLYRRLEALEQEYLKDAQ